MAATRRAPGALFCDTNVLVRILTGDPPHQARAAARALEAAPSRYRIIVTDVVIAELAYVLTSVSELRPRIAAERIREVLDLPGVEVADDEVIRDALYVWSGGKLDFADAYLAALARGTRGTGVLSFDRDHDRIDGVVRVDPRSR